MKALRPTLVKARCAAEKYHLTFGPDPATHNYCALGGMIGNNSCGVHTLMAGKTADNILEMEILTYDGLLLDELLPENGFNVARALVGSVLAFVGVILAWLWKQKLRTNLSHRHN